MYCWYCFADGTIAVGFVLPVALVIVDVAASLTGFPVAIDVAVAAVAYAAGVAAVLISAALDVAVMVAIEAVVVADMVAVDADPLASVLQRSCIYAQEGRSPEKSYHGERIDATVQHNKIKKSLWKKSTILADWPPVRGGHQ